MRVKYLIQTLTDLVGIRRPVYLTGAPGGGKTSVAQQVAETLGMAFTHIHMPNQLVEDFGVPDMAAAGDTFGYKLPERWMVDPDIPTLICLDDRGQCGTDIQKLVANIIDARELHGHRFPDSVAFVSTGNRKEDGAGVNRVLTHLADRETELEFDVHLDDWCTWAIDEGVHPSVISFVRFRPGLLHEFDPQRPKNPTPRLSSLGSDGLSGAYLISTTCCCILRRLTYRKTRLRYTPSVGPSLIRLPTQTLSVSLSTLTGCPKNLGYSP